MEVTSQGKLDFGVNVERRIDGRGFPYYWLKFDNRQGDFREGTDIHALKAGKISVTPLKLDLTDHSLLDRIDQALRAPDMPHTVSSKEGFAALCLRLRRGASPAPSS